MTGNTSATGGFLAPTNGLPLEDQDLDVLLQQTITGVTGLTKSLVRPRWQPVPPQQPEITVNWCAVGVVEAELDYRPAIVHYSDGDGYSELRNNETLTALTSFYGPNAAGYAALLRDGLQIGQNREAMEALGLRLIETQTPVTLPALVNQQWQRRVDMRMIVRRQVTREYAILNILSASGTIVRDGPGSQTERTTPWAVNGP